MGFEPTTTRLKATRSKPTELNGLVSQIVLQEWFFKIDNLAIPDLQLHEVGFEPTKHDAIELESIPFNQTWVLMYLFHVGLEPTTLSS